MNGVINVMKPPGMSSNGVVQFLKKTIGERHIGHAGTLDTGAAGVLVVLLGRSARLSDYIMAHSKTYVAEICFGAATDTLDSYGCIVESKNTAPIDRQRLAVACAGFLGWLLQTPPDYSAVKINGKKSYEMARKGISVKKQPRKIHVEAADVLACTGPGRFLLRIQCSKGTYVRTLLADIARSMGEIAYTSFLLRIESGQYSVQAAYMLDEIAAMAEKADYSFLQPPESAVGELPLFELEGAYTFALENGQSIPEIPPTDVFRLYCGGKFYGVGCRAGEALRLKIPLY